MNDIETLIKLQRKNDELQTLLVKRLSEPLADLEARLEKIEQQAYAFAVGAPTPLNA